VARLSRGDREAFAVLVERHAPALYRVAWRVSGGHRDCEDWVQEALLRLWKKPSALRDGAAVRGWLMRTVSNLAIDRLRASPQLPLDEIAEPAAVPDGESGRQYVAGSVDAAIAALPERQRLALVLVYYENLSNREVAAALDLSVEAVESLLSRGRRALRERLAGEKKNLFDDLDELNG
jgi:RNA polymerase sigma-70 factor (ECF subfamily)